MTTRITFAKAYGKIWILIYTPRGKIREFQVVASIGIFWM